MASLHITTDHGGGDGNGDPNRDSRIEGQKEEAD